MAGRLHVAIVFVVAVTVGMPWPVAAGTPADELRARLERIQQIVTAADART